VVQHSPDASELHQILIHASPVAIVVVDPHGCVQLWNPAAERLFGWSAAEILGQPAPNIPEHDRATFIAWLNSGLQAPQRREVQRLRKDGSMIRLRVLTAPLRTNEGQLLGILGMHTELSEQILAEAELARQQKLLQTVVDNIPVMIGFFGTQGEFLLVNREWERVLGWDAAAMNAEPDMMAHFYPDPVARQDALTYMLAAKTDWRRFTTTTRYGHTIEAAWSNVHLPDGTSIGIGQDVTELTEQAEALQRQLDLMQQLLESIPFGYIYVAAPSGTILHYNAQAEQILGHAIIANASIVAETLQHAYHPDGRRFAAHEYPVMQVLQHREAVRASEIRYQRPDGNLITLRTSSVPVCHSKGQMIGVINLFEDITEHRQLEEHLLQVQKMESVGRLAGGIAHDFNNLLVPILGYVDLSMSSLPPNSKLYIDLQQVRIAAERAADLTRQILAFSRRQMLEMRLLDLNELVRNFQQMIWRLIGEDIQIYTTYTPNLPPIRADKSQIEQVLLNLVVNARDAMPTGGQLWIETQLVQADSAALDALVTADTSVYVVLRVRDTGHGMDSATQKLIFEPFFTTKEPGKGTGLGLATVFGIIKQHHGVVMVESEPHQGATFSIYLPPAQAEQAPQVAVPHNQPLVGNETLLVVEDDALVRQWLCESLRLYGYNLIEAAHASAAIQQAQAAEQPIDLLLTDVIMPGMNGHELYQHLRQQHPDLRVLYISGYTDAAVLDHAAHDLSLTFLQKPFSINDLTRRLRELLDH
jgi:PAS domain S-box-containing protein